MSSFEAVDDDVLAKLRRQDLTSSSEVGAGMLGETTFSSASEEYLQLELKECQHCGWCENPDKCVWGVICPICHAEPKEQCRTPTDGRITGLHAERWEAV